MTRVICDIELSPGVKVHHDAERDVFFVQLGRLAVELRNGTISVGEVAQAGWLERPLLRVGTSD